MFRNKIKSFITAHNLLTHSRPVLVALSGGADSVALLRVLLALGYDCRAAHCNFHLRGDESNRDETFAKDLCSNLGVSLTVKHFNVTAYMSEHGVSLEMACRDLRYRWFRELMRELDCQAIAVAHHCDDNIETFLLNALRGTGITGLAAMQPRNGDVVRPMLAVGRDEIVQYLNELGQRYVTDSTNLESDALRNRLRNIILPVVYANFDHARSRLLHTIASTASCANLYDEAIALWRKQLCRYAADGSFSIDLNALSEVKNRETLLYELLKPLGFNAVQCHDMFTAAVGRHFVSNTHLAHIGRCEIEISPQAEQQDEEIAIDLSQSEINEPVHLTIKHLEATTFNRKMVNGTTTVALSDEILSAGRVVLRHWREGDRLRPYGMRGTKLVSDLFTDLKLTERQKRATWLLCAGDTIVWVLGHRAAQAFTITPATDSFLLLTLHN